MQTLIKMQRSFINQKGFNMTGRQKFDHESSVDTVGNGSNFEQAVSSRFQRVFDRLSFIEDALSRVELQQDTMRPVFKLIENSTKQSSKRKLGTSKENIPFD